MDPVSIGIMLKEARNTIEEEVRLFLIEAQEHHSNRNITKFIETAVREKMNNNAHGIMGLQDKYPLYIEEEKELEF